MEYFRVHRVEVLDRETGKSTIYTGRKLLEAYPKSIARQAFRADASRFQPTDNGLRFEKIGPKYTFWVYGTQKGQNDGR